MTDSQLEQLLINRLEIICDGLARTTLEMQKRKLGIENSQLSDEQFILLCERIREIVKQMAGQNIADKVYGEIMSDYQNSMRMDKSEGKP